MASLLLALRACGLAAHAAATAWVVLVERSLHVDLESARACAERVRRLAAAPEAAALLKVVPPPKRDCGHVAIIAAARALGIAVPDSVKLDPAAMAELAAAAPAPVSDAGPRAADAARPRSDVFRACVIAEAVLRGAPASDAAALGAAAARLEAEGGGR